MSSGNAGASPAWPRPRSTRSSVYMSLYLPLHGRFRGGLTTKVHLAADSRCRPLAFIITPSGEGGRGGRHRERPVRRPPAETGVERGPRPVSLGHVPPGPSPSGTSTRSRSGSCGRPAAFAPAMTRAAAAGRTPTRHRTVHGDSGSGVRPGRRRRSASSRPGRRPIAGRRPIPCSRQVAASLFALLYGQLLVNPQEELLRGVLGGICPPDGDAGPSMISTSSSQLTARKVKRLNVSSRAGEGPASAILARNDTTNGDAW